MKNEDRGRIYTTREAADILNIKTAQGLIRYCIRPGKWNKDKEHLLRLKADEITAGSSKRYRIYEKDLFEYKSQREKPVK